MDELHPFIDDKDWLSELADGLRAWVLGCVCSAGLHVSSQLNAVRSLATDAGSLPISPKKTIQAEMVCAASAAPRREQSEHGIPRQSKHACILCLQLQGSCSQAEPVAHALMRRVV